MTQNECMDEIQRVTGAKQVRFGGTFRFGQYEREEGWLFWTDKGKIQYRLPSQRWYCGGDNLHPSLEEAWAHRHRSRLDLHLLLGIIMLGGVMFGYLFLRFL